MHGIPEIRNGKTTKKKKKNRKKEKAATQLPTSIFCKSVEQNTQYLYQCELSQWRTDTQ
jgi:hypothetical protein